MGLYPPSGLQGKPNLGNTSKRHTASREGTPATASGRRGRALCSFPHMATNLDLDPDLIERAVALSGAPTKRAAVTAALQEFIARREQRRLLELFGKLEWDPAYDYKRERARD
jgi:hypothetical protein